MGVDWGPDGWETETDLPIVAGAGGINLVAARRGILAAVRVEVAAEWGWGQVLACAEFQGPGLPVMVGTASEYPLLGECYIKSQIETQGEEERQIQTVEEWEGFPF